MAVFYLPEPDPDIDLDTDALAKQVEPARDLAEQFAQAEGGPWMPRTSGEQIKVVVVDGEVYLTNTDYAAHLLEFGSANNPAHAPLRRAATASGLRLEET